MENDKSEIEKFVEKVNKKTNYRGLYRVTQYVWTDEFSAEDFEDAIEAVDTMNISADEYGDNEREHELVEIENTDTGETEPI